MIWRDCSYLIWYFRFDVRRRNRQWSASKSSSNDKALLIFETVIGAQSHVLCFPSVPSKTQKATNWWLLHIYLPSRACTSFTTNRYKYQNAVICLIFTTMLALISDIFSDKIFWQIHGIDNFFVRITPYPNSITRPCVIIPSPPMWTRKPVHGFRFFLPIPIYQSVGWNIFMAPHTSGVIEGE